MSVVPVQRIRIRFDRSYQGSFGRFNTDVSYSVQYLMTSLSIDDINDLFTASETLDLDTIRFNELIQRDIDKQRVRRIADEYLRAGHNRPIFFPPLIASVALLEEAGSRRLKNQYETVERARSSESGYDTLLTTYDRDGFELRLPVADEKHSGRKIEWEGQELHYYDYAAELGLNSRRAKLVVLDGQHRLEALRTLLHTPENRKIISTIELPICIVWPPEARVGQINETIIGDFRELFVTINSEPQRVSGHFLILLDDGSYTSMVVRELADAWKGEKDEGWSRLHLLEWNTRENESTDKRTRPYSITTISIVAKVLRHHLFAIGGLPAKMLSLASRQAELETLDADFQITELKDDRQAPAINDVVRQQVCNELVPALNALLRGLRPYDALQKRLGAAFARSMQKAKELNTAHISLNQQLARFVYTFDDQTADAVVGAYADFRNWIRDEGESETYFLAVFQQGALRMWLRLAALLEGITALAAANATVGALNTFAVKRPTAQQTLFLAPELTYCRRVLWRAEAVNFSAEWARKAWHDILMATLLRDDVRAAALAALPQDKELQRTYDQSLVDIGLQAARSYADRLWDETLRETRNNLGDYFGEAEAGRLRELKQTNMKEFERIVSENAQDRYRAALTLLANRLSRPTAELLRTA